MYNCNANKFEFSKVNAKSSDARIFGAKARFKNWNNIFTILCNTLLGTIENVFL